VVFDWFEREEKGVSLRREDGEISTQPPPSSFPFAAAAVAFFLLLSSPSQCPPLSRINCSFLHSTDLGHGVTAVLGVTGTLFVRRPDEQADARSGDDGGRRHGDVGAVEAGPACAGRRRGQARRPDEGGREHGSL
jgi:hypothetical protein